MEYIQSIDDPRVAAYRNLPDRTLRGEAIFVTEGRGPTRRLLASRCQAESVLVAEAWAEEFAPLVPAGVPLYVAAESLLAAVVGFHFHRGALAAGRRPAAQGLDEMLGSRPADAPLRLVVCPDITKPENMGLVFRSAVGMGLDGVLLGPRCCDPFSRRVLRVSMGAVLDMPLVKSRHLAADLRRLAGHWQVELVAAVADPAAARLAEVAWPRRAAVLVGNESDGLRPEWLDLCRRRVTIPMSGRTDSLNLGVAAAIFMYEMTRD